MQSEGKNREKAEINVSANEIHLRCTIQSMFIYLFKDVGPTRSHENKKKAKAETRH